MFKSSVLTNDDDRYVATNCVDVFVEPLKIKLSNDSKLVDWPLTKSILTLKLGPFIGGHDISSCSVNTIVSINGLAINLVIHNVEFSDIFAFNGVYNLRIMESTLFFTFILPIASVSFSDNVQSSFSQEEIIICSSFPKLARCVKYLLSFSGSIILNFSLNDSNIADENMFSSNWTDGIANSVLTSYSLPINSSTPPLLNGLNIKVTLLLPAQLTNLSLNDFILIDTSPFGVKFLNNVILLLSFNNKSTSIVLAANDV